MLQENMRFLWVFIWKFLYINHLTPFLGVLTPFFHTSKFAIYTIQTSWLNATRIYKVYMGFVLKIPLYKPFHTFLRHFHTFFSHLQISNKNHNNRLYKYYKNIYGFCGFLFENSSISTISHLFWAFSHLFFTPPNF